MKRQLLTAFGWLVSRPAVFWAIRKYASKHPHSHLYDKPDAAGVRSLYMGRWRVVDEGTRASRILETLTGYVSCRLHHINRADHDRHQHSHPFGYRTFICKGFYGEEYEDGVQFTSKRGGFYRFPEESECGTIAPRSRCVEKGYRFVHAGGTATGAHDKFHRIDQISKGGVWTLFFMDKNQDEWGFNVDSRLVPSVRYFLRNGYDKPTIRAAQTDNKAEQ
jgi:hypothetical protein